MSENLKTLLFLLIGAAMLALAWLARPALPMRDAFDDSGERFFAAFDPLAARRLEIITFDEKEAMPRTFAVAQQNGVWSLPSNEDYPADAKDQLAKAATALGDVVKGPKVSDLPGDHELYGVVDPTSASAASLPGAGTRVKLTDEAGNALVDLIVGKPVKDTPELRYVRVPGKDRVYPAKVALDQLSTRFEDWIEKDLLKLSTTDISDITINGYSIDELNNRIVPGDVLRLSINPTDRKWQLDGLGDNEKLVTAKLDTLRRSLADLKIVNVHRKPPGLSAELRATDAMSLDVTDRQSLASRGYYVVEGQLLSNEGEMTVSLKTGVQYVLRFGEIALDAVPPTLAAPTNDGADEDQLYRYLFITAQFNDDLIPPPQLQPVPEPSAPVAAESAEGGEPSPAPDDSASDEARQLIEEANEKKLADFQKSVDDGRRKVEELNARFADWYYVIDDDVYAELRLARADIVEPAAAAAAPSPVPAP
jgi:hypothetical protein